MITAAKLVEMGVPSVLADYLAEEIGALDASALGTRVTTLETDVGALETDVGTLQSDVGAIDTRVTALENPAP